MQSSNRRLVVLHTNDIHSSFDPLPKAASLINKLKKQYAADKPLLIDCGDHMERMISETEGTSGLINIEVMNQTGYDLFLPGNREGLIFPYAVLDRVISNHAKFKIICSNLSRNDTGEAPDWMEPFEIIDLDGFRVGITGVTFFLPQFYNPMGWNIRDPFEAVADWTHRLRQQVDIIVVLSHLGLSYDERMAAEIPGIHLIFGAHTHHLLESPRQIGQTYLCGAGEKGRHVGVLELEYNPSNKKIERVSGRCIRTDGEKDDPSVLRIIEKHREQANVNLRRPIVSISEPLELDWHQESALGNLLASGLRQRAEAEIGLINAGQFLHGLQAGPVSRETLMEVCPSPAKTCRTLLKGEHLRTAIEEALLPEYTTQYIDKYNFQGKAVGTLCLDGVTVQYDDKRRPHKKITKMLVNGEPLDPAREYTVGTVDMLIYGLGYPSLVNGRDTRFFLPDFPRDIVESQLQIPKEISLCTQTRWVRKNAIQH